MVQQWYKETVKFIAYESLRQVSLLLLNPYLFVYFLNFFHLKYLGVSLPICLLRIFSTCRTWTKYLSSSEFLFYYALRYTLGFMAGDFMLWVKSGDCKLSCPALLQLFPSSASWKSGSVKLLAVWMVMLCAVLPCQTSSGLSALLSVMPLPAGAGCAAL